MIRAASLLCLVAVACAGSPAPDRDTDPGGFGPHGNGHDTDAIADTPADTQGPPAQLDHVCAGVASYRYAWPVAAVDLAAAAPWGTWAIDDDGARWQALAVDADAIPVSFCVCSADGCTPRRFLLTPITR